MQEMQEVSEMQKKYRKEMRKALLRYPHVEDIFILLVKYYDINELKQYEDFCSIKEKAIFLLSKEVVQTKLPFIVFGRTSLKVLSF